MLRSEDRMQMKRRPLISVGASMLFTLVAIGACGGRSDGGGAAPDASGGPSNATTPTSDAASGSDAPLPPAPVNRWMAQPPMFTARARLAAAPALGLAHSSVLAIGGQDDIGNVFDSAELFDGASTSWATKTVDVASMSVRRTAAAAASLVIDNVGGVLYAGGLPDPSVAPVADVTFYDGEKDAWRALAPMSGTRASFVTVPVTIGGVAGVLAIGGSGTAVGAEFYDPTKDAWRSVAPLPTPRYGIAAAPLVDGRVLVVGGADQETAGHYYAFAHVYDPNADTWKEVAPLSTPRVGAAAAPVTIGGNTGVLVVGGAPSPGGAASLATAEFYDGSSWRAVAPMSTARAGLAAAQVAIGNVLGVLVVGGANTATVATAEFYQP
jgi:hypothetical protein